MNLRRGHRVVGLMRVKMHTSIGRAGLAGVMALTLCLAGPGCAGVPHAVTYAAINPPPRPFVRRAAADVDVTVGKPPARAHVDVGLFEVYQGSNDDSTRPPTEGMIATLRLHAALRGCDA